MRSPTLIEKNLPPAPPCERGSKMVQMTVTALRLEAWRVLEGESAILDTARDVSRILRESKIRGAIVGGIAVGLHGHVRATMDVDVYVPAPLDSFATMLSKNGYVFDAKRREFRRRGIPIQIVTDEQTGGPPARISTIQQIQTVGLADLINMKLRSGTESVLRAQDIADVIALIRVCKLNGTFAAIVQRTLRAEFKRLVAAVRSKA